MDDLDKQFIRSQLLVGSREDFLMVIRGMSPIKNVPGINEKSPEWWICPITACVIHLVRIEDRAPLEDRYCFYLILYNPNGKGYTRSGHKIVRIGNKTYSLSHLVACTFVPNDDPKKTIVIHKNFNKRDLRADNLAWATRKEARNRKRIKTIKLHLRKQGKEGVI